MAGWLGQVLMPLKHVNQMIDVLGAMAGIQLDPKTRGFHRHGRKRDGVDMNAFLANCQRKFVRFGLVAEPDRDDRCLRRYQPIIQLSHAFDEVPLIVP